MWCVKGLYYFKFTSYWNGNYNSSWTYKGIWMLKCHIFYVNVIIYHQNHPNLPKQTTYNDICPSISKREQTADIIHYSKSLDFFTSFLTPVFSISSCNLISDYRVPLIVSPPISNHIVFLETIKNYQQAIWKFISSIQKFIGLHYHISCAN